MAKPATIATSTTPQENLVINAVGVCKAFGSNRVLDHFDFRLYKGENVVILGKSGSGKSVFIKCLIGLLTADEGAISILGHDIASLSQEDLDRLRTRVGFLFQSNALYDSMSVRENLEFPLRRQWMKIPVADMKEKVTKVLENVGLVHTIDMMPAELSGGMRKRIALARTLIVNPEVMLYDEPTTGLDPITAREIVVLMKELGEKYQMSSIIISHDMNCIRSIADRIVLLYDGRAYAVGTFQELKSSNDEVITRFFE